MFVGISENVGHDMTFKIINRSTNKIINRSTVRPENDKKSPNLRADPLTSPEIIKSLHNDSIPNTDETASNDYDPPSSSKWSMFILDPSIRLVRSFF